MFCTASDVQAFLQVEISAAQLPMVDAAIRGATAAIRNYCNQYISYVQDDEVVFDGQGGTKLFLPELPVVSVKTVVEDDVELESGVDYKLGANGVLHRLGAEWPEGIQNISVTYTHGYGTIPEDIVLVCTRAAARTYQAGLRAAEMAGVPGVSSKSLGDFSVSYGSEQSVGAGEAMLGASAAPPLLRLEQQLLNRYRYERL